MCIMIVTLTFLILVLVGSAFPQSAESAVATIRTIYATTNKRIEDGLGGDKTLGLHYAV